jgi:hypothetical protein
VFGTAPLAVGAAHVALREKDAGIVAGSGRALTFGGRPTASVPAGATLVSDPVALTVPDFADLAIDVHLPGDTGAGSSPLTVHNGALQTNYVSQPGNHVGTAVFPVASTTAAWFFLARVEVEPTGPAASWWRSAIHSPMARPRRPIRTIAGRIIWRAACLPGAVYVSAC